MQNNLYLKKEIGFVGLGKMGWNMASRLVTQGWKVVAFDRSSAVVAQASKEKMRGVSALRELVENLSAPRVIWVMVPAGKPVEDVFFGPGGLTTVLRRGDIIIDGGNSFFEDSVRRAAKLKKAGLRFLDVGVSGGPGGARHGSALMVGGEERNYLALEGLFKDLAVPGGYGYMGSSGAGHFVKMVHNGIEYGMMQAIAEGFAVMRKSKLKLSLTRVVDIYNHGSVIESRLMGWLKSAFETYGEDLKKVSGAVAATGEGEWTVKTGRKLKVSTPIIEGAFKFRLVSLKKPNYTGQILSALRNQFGGHAISPISKLPQGRRK